MPTLQELKDKWFIDENTAFIEPPAPQEGVDPDPDSDDDPGETTTFNDIGLNFRHTGTALLNHTDGNNITILGEGNVYLEKWYDLITDKDTITVYNTNWRIDNVLTKQSEPTSTALDTLVRVANNSVAVYQFVDGNIMASNTNEDSWFFLNLNGVNAFRDLRFPSNFGSNHQKFMVAKSNSSGCALVGSIDITVNRLDDNSHIGNFDKITHDFGVLVEGPAVADIERTFVERWNDSSRNLYNPLINDPIGTYAQIGSHSVQVLRTYGLSDNSYSWAQPPEKGEFSIWASTLNAIKKAEKYIYIEDQTFLTLGYPTRCDDKFNPARRRVDLVYQIGEALKRLPKIRVGIILSKKGANPFETYQRNFSIDYLRNIANEYNSELFIGYIDNGSGFIYLHSKLFMVDDEFALIGSANFDQRSMTHDSELKIGVVDENNLFVKELRSKLFTEHSERDDIDFSDPIDAFDLMKSFVEDPNQTAGRLRNYDFSTLEKPFGHETVVNKIGWPYAGPLNLK